eukprot:TRINITY_DN331_c0_g1_i8.p1 TRINITY_DN331_c0_g1~~TRINITY_DN331_c0_g1_i8.p1  ORF type:complete len:169 (+),score=31.39 TRINITY_DN331_c0_g1_i8:431-937(+)
MSLGGPHMGVYRFPYCITSKFCAVVAEILSYAIDIPIIQDFIAPAQFYRDPHRPEDFLRVSRFLADLNNERPNKNQQYKDRIINLDLMVLVKFAKDHVIYPKVSEWFGYVDKRYGGDEIVMQETELYKQDYIGLRELNERGALKFMELPGEHVEWTNQDLKNLAKELV